MSFTLVSFYTEKTPYENEVKNLIASVSRFNVPSRIEGVKSLGSWEKNCQYKANYILDAMQQLDTDIVWVDADAVLIKYPSLFDQLDCDIAYYYMEHRRELLSGTLFIRNNEKMKDMVSKWIELNRTNYKWDQKNLQQLVEADTGLRKEVLPAEYCKIYDNKLQSVSEPVIMHYQASRRFKRAVGPAPAIRA
jgi:hypothetical protein